MTQTEKIDVILSYLAYDNDILGSASVDNINRAYRKKFPTVPNNEDTYKEVMLIVEKLVDEKYIKPVYYEQTNTTYSLLTKNKVEYLISHKGKELLENGGYNYHLREQSKSKFWKSFKDYTPIAFTAIGLVVSIKSCLISEQANATSENAKQQVSKLKSIQTLPSAHLYPTQAVDTQKSIK